jgi:DNA-binding transcriptional LysR family regulator
LLLTLDVSLDTEHPREVLFDDEFVVVACKKNEHISGRLTREQFAAAGHVATHFGRTRLLSFPDWILQSQFPDRRIELYAPTFLTIPSMLVGTNRIALMPRRIAERAAAYMPLAVLRSPISVPKVNMVAMWHKANNHDKAIRWVASALAHVGLSHATPAAPDPETRAAYLSDLRRRYTDMATTITRH